jgi:hypothetical protein
MAGFDLGAPPTFAASFVGASTLPKSVNGTSKRENHFASNGGAKNETFAGIFLGLSMSQPDSLQGGISFTG